MYTSMHTHTCDSIIRRVVPCRYYNTDTNSIDNNDNSNLSSHTVID